MSEEVKKQEEEISLLDLLAVMLKYKKLIIGVTIAGALLSVIISIISIILPPEKSFLPNQYAPQAQMLINDDSSSGSSALSSLSSVASLAGISLGSGSGVSNSALATYLVNSNTIQDAVINKFNFIEAWKITKSPLFNSRKMLKEKLSCNYDTDSCIFTISFLDIDPKLGQEVVNYVVELLEKRFKELGVDKNQLEKTNLEENINYAYDQIITLQKQLEEIESSVSNVMNPFAAPNVVTEATLVKTELEVQKEVYKQLKVQYESLKVSMASEKPVFQILEYAEIPDRKAKPSRGKLCIIITLASGFLSVFLAFLLNAIHNIRQDPLSMSKFKN